MNRIHRLLIFLLLVFFLAPSLLAKGTIRIGSKKFNESHILAEIFSLLLESKGYKIQRKFWLGGTMVCYRALSSGQIDVYVEYTGTIEKAILKLGRKANFDTLKKELLEREGITLMPSLGFNNTYALAVKPSTAKELKLNSISDLVGKQLRYGLTHEFLDREDGFKGLKRHYGLVGQPTGMVHGLAYIALNDKRLDVVDVYSTDGEIKRYNLQLLKDDKNFFTKYYATPMLRAGFDKEAQEILASLTNQIDEATMQRLNSFVLLKQKTVTETAADFLAEKNLAQVKARSESWLGELAFRTYEHLYLTLLSVLLAALMAIPLAIFISWYEKLAHGVIYFTGLLQTIPSIALLALFVPMFGLGFLPALIALFLYGLLPILRATFNALDSVDPVIKDVAEGMGFSRFEKMRYIELPLATINIFAGLRTAAVINVGTATLAAFVGAGGLGHAIMRGLDNNDTALILQGTIPASLLAIALELLLGYFQKKMTAEHLKQSGNKI